MQSGGTNPLFFILPAFQFCEDNQWDRYVVGVFVVVILVVIRISGENEDFQLIGMIAKVLVKASKEWIDRMDHSGSNETVQNILASTGYQ